MLAQPCKAVRRSHGRSSSVSFQADRGSLSMALLTLVEARRLSELILVSKH